MKLADEPCNQFYLLKSPEVQFICVLETLSDCCHFHRHLSASKNIGAESGGLGQVGLVFWSDSSSGQNTKSRARDAPCHLGQPEEYEQSQAVSHVSWCPPPTSRIYALETD